LIYLKQFYLLALTKQACKQFWVQGGVVCQKYDAFVALLFEQYPAKGVCAALAGVTDCEQTNPIKINFISSNFFRINLVPA
jgi:hypothetical protein